MIAEGPPRVTAMFLSAAVLASGRIANSQAHAAGSCKKQDILKGVSCPAEDKGIVSCCLKVLNIFGNPQKEKERRARPPKRQGTAEPPAIFGTVFVACLPPQVPQLITH